MCNTYDLLFEGLRVNDNPVIFGIDNTTEDSWHKMKGYAGPSLLRANKWRNMICSKNWLQICIGNEGGQETCIHRFKEIPAKKQLYSIQFNSIQFYSVDIPLLEVSLQYLQKA